MNIILLGILVASSAFFGTITSKSTTTTVSPDVVVGLIPLCGRNDPDINECIKNATISLREKINAGIPELSLPSFDPITIPTIKLQQTSDSLAYKAVLTDVNIYGVTDYEFTDVIADMENFTITMKAVFEHVYVNTEYMIMGKFEMLPIEGSGRLMANYTESTADIKLLGSLVKRKDETYFANNDVEVNVTVGDSFIDFENLFTGGAMKSQISDHIIQMHSEEVTNELQPAVENLISMLVDNVASKFFKSLPYDKLFPK